MCKVFSSSYSSAESSYTAGSDGEESACDAGDPGSITGSGRSPGEGNGNLLWYSCLENSMDRGAWWATVHGVAKSQTRMSDSHHTQFSCEVGQSLDPVPPARGVLSSARCILIVKPQSQTQALVPSMGPPRMFCSPVYGFQRLTIWKTGRRQGEKATWLPSKSSKLKRPDWR